MSPADRATGGLDATRRRLAQLETAAEAEGDISNRRRIEREADDLRREIGRAERGEDRGKVDQPREVTRGEIMQAYAGLATSDGELVSLVRLRAALPHISHEELSAVLKQMDRERAIQLVPESNQKALPPEAREAAVTLGGTPQHFISMRR